MQGRVCLCKRYLPKLQAYGVAPEVARVFQYLQVLLRTSAVYITETVNIGALSSLTPLILDSDT